MRSLSIARRELIEALVAESDVGGITAALLEKDEHLTDALRAVFSLEIEGLRLVFCGGTSLSKAHGLIERMSEDADIKVVGTYEAASWSRSRLRTELRGLRKAVTSTMTDLGFVEDTQQASSLNENRFAHSQWAYEEAYEGAAALRPNLQLEFVYRKPVLATDRCSISSLADRLAGRAGDAFEVETISIAETQAEKVLSFLRRFSQHRSGQMNREWDAALVRHIYDVHCIHVAHAELLTSSAGAFSQLLAGDVSEFGRQQPEFAANPVAILAEALNRSAKDEQTQMEFDRNLLPLVYGNHRPDYSNAFASFETVARKLLDRALAK
jgi:predicted nucleotidyltransferase component of viral defense system